MRVLRWARWLEVAVDMVLNYLAMYDLRLMIFDWFANECRWPQRRKSYIASLKS
jgi:hypothetical protein